MSRTRKKNSDLDIQLAQDPLSNPVSRGRRVRLLRHMTNLSRDEAAEKYPLLNANTLKSWEIGREGGLTPTGAKLLLEMASQEGVECTHEWLMYQIGEGPRITDLTKTTSEPSFIGHKSQKQQIIDELRLFRVHHPDAIDLNVKDNGMMPFFQIGDHVAGIPRYKQSIEQLVGCNCIVQLSNNEKLLRRLRLGSKPNHYSLYCVNLETSTCELVLTDVEIVCAAPAIWHRKLDLNN